MSNLDRNNDLTTFTIYKTGSERTKAFVKDSAEHLDFAAKQPVFNEELIPEAPKNV